LNVDFTIDQEKLMNNPYVQKCLSLQAALGSTPSPYHRSPSSAVAWFTIQLRETSILFAYFCYCTKNGEMESYDAGRRGFSTKSDPITRTNDCVSTEILRIILGNVKWALDFAKYLIDHLFELAEDLHSQPSEPGSAPQACMATACFPCQIE
jgi:mediator of RNA polymerase II transcription subunit 16